MDRKAALAGLAVALLVSAGALGVYVITDTPDQAPDGSSAAALPDGLSPDGHTNASELVATHRDALNDTSYATTHSMRASYANGTHLANWTHALDVDPQAETYHWVQTANATLGQALLLPDRVATWSNGSVAVSRWGTSNETRYTRRETHGDAPGIRYRLHGVLGGVNTTFEGQPFAAPFTVHATSVVDASDLRSDDSFENPRNVTFTATITERGIVESYRLAYTATFRGDRIRVVERYELTARGIDVPEPDWVDEAVRRTAS